MARDQKSAEKKLGAQETLEEKKGKKKGQEKRSSAEKREKRDRAEKNSSPATETEHLGLSKDKAQLLLMLQGDFRAQIYALAKEVLTQQLPKFELTDEAIDLILKGHSFDAVKESLRKGFMLSLADIALFKSVTTSVREQLFDRHIKEAGNLLPDITFTRLEFEVAVLGDPKLSPQEILLQALADKKREEILRGAEERREEAEARAERQRTHRIEKKAVLKEEKRSGRMAEQEGLEKIIAQFNPSANLAKLYASQQSPIATPYDSTEDTEAITTRERPISNNEALLLHNLISDISSGINTIDLSHTWNPVLLSQYPERAEEKHTFIDDNESIVDALFSLSLQKPELFSNAIPEDSILQLDENAQRSLYFTISDYLEKMSRNEIECATPMHLDFGINDDEIRSHWRRMQHILLRIMGLDADVIKMMYDKQQDREVSSHKRKIERLQERGKKVNAKRREQFEKKLLQFPLIRRGSVHEPNDITSRLELVCAAQDILNLIQDLPDTIVLTYDETWHEDIYNNLDAISSLGMEYALAAARLAEKLRQCIVEGTDDGDEEIEEDREESEKDIDDGVIIMSSTDKLKIGKYRNEIIGESQLRFQKAEASFPNELRNELTALLNELQEISLITERQETLCKKLRDLRYPRPDSIALATIRSIHTALTQEEKAKEDIIDRQKPFKQKLADEMKSREEALEQKSHTENLKLIFKWDTLRDAFFRAKPLEGKKAERRADAIPDDFEELKNARRGAEIRAVKHEKLERNLDIFKRTLRQLDEKGRLKKVVDISDVVANAQNPYSALDTHYNQGRLTHLQYTILNGLVSGKLRPQEAAKEIVEAEYRKEETAGKKYIDAMEKMRLADQRRSLYLDYLEDEFVGQNMSSETYLLLDKLVRETGDIADIPDMCQRLKIGKSKEMEHVQYNEVKTHIKKIAEILQKNQ